MGLCLAFFIIYDLAVTLTFDLKFKGSRLSQLHKRCKFGKISASGKRFIRYRANKLYRDASTKNLKT